MKTPSYKLWSIGGPVFGALWLIAPPNRPDKAIPAALFE